MSIEEFRNILDNGPAKEKERKHHDNPEHRLQCRMIKWFYNVYRNHIIMAIPNGGHRNIITARKLKDEGVLAGVPDLLIPESNGEYNCLWIEVKNGKDGRVSKSQQHIHDILKSNGNAVEIARTFEEFCKIVNTYLGHGTNKD